MNDELFGHRGLIRVGILVWLFDADICEVGNWLSMLMQLVEVREFFQERVLNATIVRFKLDFTDLLSQANN